jgi:hypothetical protein
MPLTDARLLCVRGAIGPIAAQAQHALIDQGRLDGAADGIFGPRTEAAIRSFQDSAGIAPTGRIDFGLWPRLTGSPVPRIRERALQITATFENHSFTRVAGNFDRAGITWGIIGFTLAGGELGAMLLRIDQLCPGLIAEAFGTDAAARLLGVLSMPLVEQLAFADSISYGPKKAQLSDPWRLGFELLGEDRRVQAIQLVAAEEDYWVPAVQTAAKFGLTTELGLALCFDIHVQNGGIKLATRKILKSQLEADPPATECARRVIIARAVAMAASARWQADVLSRKMAIATGSGTVHGTSYRLSEFGLWDVPANP